SAADVGCGTGGFLSYLLRYRVPLWGVDSSPSMLRIALRRLPRSRVRLLRQDIRALRLPRAVDLIVCNGDTLNYLLTRDELVLGLARCRENLTPCGSLVGDILTGIPSPSVEGWRAAPSMPCVASMWRSEVDPSRRLTRVDIRYRLAGQHSGPWVQETHRQRWYSIPELRLALREAGLRNPALWRLDRGEGEGAAAWVKFAAFR
ncbi:MAG: class I SAM-dependent methyltransferase, partial [Bdellovibrio bacteriovorus]